MRRLLVLLLGTVPPLVGAAAGGGPSDEALADLTCRGVLEEPVRLQDGRWLGEAFAPGAVSRPRVERARNGVARGDLDGDGVDDPMGCPTRRMCPPDVTSDQQDFLARLGQVERFGFVLGDLALSYRLDGQSGTLFFEASEENR